MIVGAPQLVRTAGLRLAPTRRGGVWVARDLAEVLAAWELVYQVYLANGLIDANPFEIHTSHAAVSDRSVVLFHSADWQTDVTITAVMDGPLGLPLDDVYGPELDALRSQGRLLMEVGLLADRRHLRPVRLHGAGRAPLQSAARSASRYVLMELMRLAFHYERNYHAGTDLVVGVHPRHAGFYARAYGFDVFGPRRTHPGVNHRPVVLLRANGSSLLKRQNLPFALQYAVRHPVTPAVFEERYRFDCDSLDMITSRLHGYLTWRSDEPALAG